MTTITNTTATKAVNIRPDGTGHIVAMYVQIYNGQEQVLQSKYFKTTAGAQRWAKKVLN